jgi:hypothetical protein
MSREVLLVGSVGLENAQEVFRTAADILGTTLPRIPDGETGWARSVWIQCQTPLFITNSALEMVEPDPDRPGEYREAHIPAGGIYSHTRKGSYFGRARLRPGVSSTDVVFSHVGYGDWAIESYEVFKGLKAEGVIPSSTRLQVSIPSPRATVGARVMPEALPIVEPAYEAGIVKDIQRMAANLPAGELAIQWDCTEPVSWDRLDAAGREEVVERLVRLAGYVPEGVELGYHLCYGDFEHEHGRQPPDASEMVELTNAVVSRVSRRIDWIHMPVPRDRSDEAYYTSLRDLKMAPETKLYLGLVHYSDGEEGTSQRMAVADQVVRDYGIATECGFGRRPREQDIRELMALHAKVALL